MCDQSESRTARTTTGARGAEPRTTAGARSSADARGATAARAAVGPRAAGARGPAAGPGAGRDRATGAGSTPGSSGAGTPGSSQGTVTTKELGAFLRAHRERRSPVAVGLPAHSRRRTPGLRREEVAALSGVGLAWYTWLEQGRVVPSKQVLEAVARTLGLDDAGHRHMLALAGLLPPAPPEADEDELIARARPLLDSLEQSPALLLDPRCDILAWNSAYAAVWSDPGDIPVVRRNLMWSVIGDPAIRAAVEDWTSWAEAVRAHFRAQTARRGEDARVHELYALLRTDFPELANWWECQGIADLTARQLNVDLPGSGRLQLQLSAFRPVDSSDGLLLVQAPVGEADRALVAQLLRSRRQPSRSGVLRFERAG